MKRNTMYYIRMEEIKELKKNRETITNTIRAMLPNKNCSHYDVIWITFSPLIFNNTWNFRCLNTIMSFVYLIKWFCGIVNNFMLDGFKSMKITQPTFNVWSHDVRQHLKLILCGLGLSQVLSYFWMQREVTIIFLLCRSKNL